MAEGWLNYFTQSRATIFSAGTAPKAVHPLAAELMSEAGVDISSHRSKHVDEFWNQTFDVVVTVCDLAREACPTFLQAGRILHQAFEDPDRTDLPEAERRALFKRVRDEIRDWSRSLADELLSPE